ncbi:hypothetical protein IFO70_07340 [Phormidium tenue FACHB-886]|nr:hypothetical protein [Phormidium tenue FACHB-886]
MNPKMIRQVWRVVDTGEAAIPLTLDDCSLVQWLICQLSSDRCLNSQEIATLSDYIRSRLPLIREMAAGY